MKLTRTRLPFAAFAAATCIGAMDASAADIVYQDTFDNDGLDTNTGIGGGAASVDTTPLDRGPGMWEDNGNLTSTGGNWGGTSANAYSLNSFDLQNGFKLEVTYNIVNAQSRLTIGLVEEAGADSPDIAVIPTSGTLPYHGLFFNPVAYDSRNRFPNAPGLQFADGTNPTQRLSNAQTNGVGGTHTLVLEMDTESNWSYSVDGVTPTTGTIGGAGFDLTRSYRFVVRNQVSSQANNIQSVTLTTTVSEPAPFPLTITPNGSNRGSYDFSWESQDRRVYDLVSSTDLSTAPNTWPVWESQADIVGTAPTNILSDIPGGSDPTRFFAVVEKDPPPLLREDFEDNDGGFTFSAAAGTDWAWGGPMSSDNGGTPNPGGSVTSGNGGSTKCWGTGIGNPGFYTDPTTDSCLRSAVIDLRGVAGAELSFAQARDFPVGDTAVVNIIDGSTGTPIISAPFPLTVTDDLDTEAGWKDAGPYALPVGGEIRIEWCFSGTGGIDDDYMGWYIDDVVVTETTP